jgi:hypothetical protein
MTVKIMVRGIVGDSRSPGARHHSCWSVVAISIETRKRREKKRNSERSAPSPKKMKKEGFQSFPLLGVSIHSKEKSTKTHFVHIPTFFLCPSPHHPPLEVTIGLEVVP